MNPLRDAILHIVGCDDRWEHVMREAVDKAVDDIEAVLDVHAVWGQS